MRSARTLRGITTLVVIAALLIALAALILPNVGEARGESVAPASATPVAAINLGDLLGNENEPDENEADEGAPAGQKTQVSGTSTPVVIALVVVALIAGAWAALRIRRLWLRLLGWGRDMRARI